MFNRKKGESLVEVMVSLGILAFIFTTAVVLITSIMVLNSSARRRTEAIAMAQKNLNEYVSSNSNLDICHIEAFALGSIISGNTGCDATDGVTATDQTCYWITAPPVTSLSATEENSALGLTNTNFVKVTSHAKWYTKPMGEQSFEISRLIGKNVQ